MNIFEIKVSRRGLCISALLGLGGLAGCTRREEPKPSKATQGGAQHKAAPANPLDPNKVEVVAMQKCGENVQLYTVNQVDRPAFAQGLRKEHQIDEAEGDHIRSFVALDNGQFVATPGNIRAVAELVGCGHDERPFAPEAAEPDENSSLTGRAKEEAELAHRLATDQANREMTPLRQHEARMTAQAAHVITEYLRGQTMIQAGQAPVQMPDARLYEGQKPYKAPAPTHGFDPAHHQALTTTTPHRVHQKAK